MLATVRLSDIEVYLFCDDYIEKYKNVILRPMIMMMLGITCVLMIGFIAHRVGICLVRGVLNAMRGRPGLLLAILMSGVWVGAYSVLANVYDWPLPPRHQANYWFALGGFIFGVGASINGGCSVSTLHQFARGNMSMLFTMFGWFVGWGVWRAIQMEQVLQPSYASLQPLSLNVVVTMFVLASFTTAAVLVAFPRQRRRWLGISLIGLLVAVLFYIEPQWAPSKLIQDSGVAVFDNGIIPSSYRYVLVVLLLAGMWLSARLIQDLRLTWPSITNSVLHLSAGTIMGLGGAISLGGNDAQILLGLPILSMGAIVTILFMLIGIATAQLLSDLTQRQTSAG